MITFHTLQDKIILNKKTYKKSMSFERIFQTTYETSIFRNRLLFDHECEPQEFKHRKYEMDTIAECMKPLLNHDKPTNAVIYGNCSTGKTTAVKRILEHIEKITTKVVCVYINSESKNKRDIYNHIHKKIFGYIIEQNRIGTSEIKNKIVSYMRNKHKSLIIVLDEADCLKKELDDIVKSLLKLHEEYYGARVGLYLIAYDVKILNLSSSTNSLFQLKEVFFNEYSKEQVYDILSKRCDYGFVKGAITERQLKEVVNVSINIRDGLSILMSLGRLAERDNSKKIKDEYLNKIIYKIV